MLKHTKIKASNNMRVEIIDLCIKYCYVSRVKVLIVFE